MTPVYLTSLSPQVTIKYCYNIINLLINEFKLQVLSLNELMQINQTTVKITLLCLLAFALLAGLLPLI